MNDMDIIGDRIKKFEHTSTGRYAFKGNPVLVRLDGRSFHTFTRGLVRPFDRRLSMLMQETTRYLVETFHAHVGYTQSDEITLMFYVEHDSQSEYIFGGRFQKLDSLLAAAASSFFNQQLTNYLPAHNRGLALFDARSFSVPTTYDAYCAFSWRQHDAMKNSVSMAAHAHFSHSKLQGKHSKQMIEMLYDEKGIIFSEYPVALRRGSFIVKRQVVTPIADDVLKTIPAQHRPEVGTHVRRNVYELMDIHMSLRPTREDVKSFLTIIGILA